MDKETIIQKMKKKKIKKTYDPGVGLVDLTEKQQKPKQDTTPALVSEEKKDGDTKKK